MITFKQVSRSATSLPDGGFRLPVFICLMATAFGRDLLPGMVSYFIGMAGLAFILIEGALCSRKVWLRMKEAVFIDRFFAVLGVASMFGLGLGIMGMFMLDVPYIRAYRMMPSPWSDLTQWVAMVLGIFPFMLSTIGLLATAGWIAIGSAAMTFRGSRHS